MLILRQIGIFPPNKFGPTVCFKQHVFVCVFFFLHALDRQMVSAHLPLAWTHSSQLEDQKFMSVMEDLAKGFQPH